MKKLGAGFVLLGVLLGCDQPGSDVLPTELLGVWSTSAPEYHGRFMEFRPGLLRIGMGEAGSSEHPISAVESSIDADSTLYTIDYLSSDGDSYRLPLRYFRTEDVLRLKNRPEITWSRQDPLEP